MKDYPVTAVTIAVVFFVLGIIAGYPSGVEDGTRAVAAKIEVLAGQNDSAPAISLSDVERSGFMLSGGLVGRAAGPLHDGDAAPIYIDRVSGRVLAKCE